MKEFVKALQKGTQRKLERIERSDLPTIRKTLEISQLLTKDFEKLKEFTAHYTFSSQAEEIDFFKEIKPRLCCRLIYYRKVYNIELNRPTGSVEEKREYLCDELRAIADYSAKRLDFIRYLRSGATHLDALYFLRGQQGQEQYLETFRHEFDPDFSTVADHNVAEIMANETLSPYLLVELETLEQKQRYCFPNPFPETRLTWQGSKAGLIELIYGFDTLGSFGNVPLLKLADYLFNVFNVEPDHNISRTFNDMKLRNSPTMYLDDMVENLRKRMGRLRRNRKNEK